MRIPWDLPFYPYLTLLILTNMQMISVASYERMWCDGSRWE